MKRAALDNDAFAAETTSDDGGASDSGSEAGDLGSRRKQAKQHRKDKARSRNAVFEATASHPEEADDSTVVQAAVVKLLADDKSDSSDDESVRGEVENDDGPAPPSATAPHLDLLLNVMLPGETIPRCIARIAKARDALADEKKRSLESEKLAQTMSAAQDLELLVSGIQVETRDQLAVRAFKAARKRLPPAYVLWWSDAVPANGWDAVPAEQWQGPFGAERMEAWRAAGFFQKKSCFVRNANAVPRELPRPGAGIASFV